MLTGLYQPGNHCSSLALWNRLHVTLGLSAPGSTEEVPNRATRIKFYPGDKDGGLGGAGYIYIYIFQTLC